MNSIIEKIKTFNTWDDQMFNTGFERTEYLTRINEYIGNKLVKVFVGQRRVGKSYILRQIIHSLIKKDSVSSKNIFYLNKEFTAFDDIKTAADLESLFLSYKKEIPVPGKIFIFLDEVQEIVNWEFFVNSYSQDFTQDYEIFVTGSNSNFFSGKLATLLSGRYVQFEIYSFSFSEFTGIKNLEPGKESFLKYLQFGGLPEMFSFEKEEIQRHYVESLKNTIVLRDIVGRHSIKDLSLLEDLFKFLMVNIGNLTSVSSLINYFKSRQKKTNYETLSSYIGFLKDTFIIHQAERYNLRGKQVLGGECKYYLNDLAFKNFLLGYYPSDIGYNLENYIFMQLTRMGYEVMVGNLNNLEIDFVARKPGKVLYVQVCYLFTGQNVIQREFGNLLKIRDNHEKMVVSLDDIRFSDYEGIKHVRPWELE